MYYTIYKITNKINGKIYIGCHQTNNLDDNYMGSGKAIKLSIKKYGVNKFIKEYLHIFDNPEEMFDMESMLVNESFIKNRSNYNIIVGGYGVGNPQNFMRGNELKEHLIKNGKYDLWRGNISKTLMYMYENGLIVPGFSGKFHTNETKMKIGKTNSIKQQGSKNSQYGSMWIYNLELKESKKIKKDSIIPNGWVKGRKMFK